MKIVLLKDKIIQGSYYPMLSVVDLAAEEAQALVDAKEAALEIAVPSRMTKADEDKPEKKKTEK